MVETGLAKSKGDARRTIAEGGAYLNNERISDPEHVPAGDRFDRWNLARFAAWQEDGRWRRIGLTITGNLFA